MELRVEKIDAALARLDALLAAAAPQLPVARRTNVERWRGDADAMRFHLRGEAGKGKRPLLLAVVGGTGTGKSTLVNRLVGRDVTAASFRRTFTSGPVALARNVDDVPPGWLGVDQIPAAADELPVRGRPGGLVVVALDGRGSSLPTLIDTPDLDGDQPAHHTQADRVFRWAEAILFAVTPEKYQMTELLPYYRLARRYAVPALFVMNKCEEQAVVDDYARQLPDREAAVFVVPRDDAGYEPPAGAGLSALRSALASVPLPDSAVRQTGLRYRAGDLLGRLNDQVVAPLRDDRREADRLIAALRAMEAPAAGVDVNPLTQQLQRRLQQRSILYLMGPQRVLDRVRQAPTLLARLPRVAWDYLRSGQVSPELLNPGGGKNEQTVPDFKAALADQFAVLQSRIDDALRASPAGAGWVSSSEPASEGGFPRVAPSEAGRIAEEELADLRNWLEKRWNATPRDTRMIESLLKYLPGGRRLMKWTEAAPYLLTIVLVTHHAFFGHIDLLVMGGYGLATWLTERISNEVTARTRATNARIETRFADLAHEQIQRACAWLDKQAVSLGVLDQLDRAAAELGEGLGEG